MKEFKCPVLYTQFNMFKTLAPTNVLMFEDKEQGEDLQ